MTVNRRFLLKGMALGGISGIALGSALPALANTVPASTDTANTLTLVNNTTAQTPFLQAAQQVNPSGMRVQTLSTDLGAMLDFNHLLRSGQPLRVIGLLDDAAGTLVIDLARGAGVRIHWLGQHSTAAGITWHRLLGPDNTEHYSRQLSQQSGQWMAQLGHHLGGHLHLSSRSHAGSVAEHIAAPMTQPAFFSTAGTPVTGSFVSFSIEA